MNDRPLPPESDALPYPEDSHPTSHQTDKPPHSPPAKDPDELSKALGNTMAVYLAWKVAGLLGKEKKGDR
jgi:hypothetical protein